MPEARSSLREPIGEAAPPQQSTIAQTAYRYERLWSVSRMLDLLDGEVHRIRREPLATVGVMADWVLEADGDVWVEEVKHRSQRWTIHRLIDSDLLAVAKVHVDQGRRFRLLTSSDAAELETLADRARRSESFADYEAFLTGGLRADFKKVAARWSVSPESAWSVLQDIEVEHEPFRSLERFIEMRLRIRYADRAESAWEALERLWGAHPREHLTAQQVLEHLESRGLRRQPRLGDTGVSRGLRQSRRRHQEHVKQFEPPGGLAPTGDVDAVVGMLRGSDGRQIVVVEGRAGSGKSTVAAAAAAALADDGWYVASVRMDVAETLLTSGALGRAMELTESPSVLLAAVSDGQPALLVVDQLDAVSLHSGRVPDSFDAVKEVLLEIEHYPNVKVLLACRTVDLERDPRLGSLRTGERVDRHAVGELDIETVRAHLAGCGLDSPDSSPTMELLRTPLHLSLFIRLSDEGRARTYVTLQQLYDRYTREVRSRVVRSVGGLDWDQTAGAIVDYMSREGVLAAPAAVLLGASPQQAEALVSESVIVRHGEVVTFFHESYFDYLFAVSFVAAGHDLGAFLLDSDQGLFRRAQARQVLEYLAATNRGRFMSGAVGLLDSDDIRYHLKVVVVAVLRSFSPTPDDWRTLKELAWSGSPLGDRVRTLLRQAGWFDAADTLGHWELWFDDPQKAGTALHEAAMASRQRAGRVAELLQSRIDGPAEWSRSLRWLVSWALSSEFVDLAVAMIEAGLFDDTDPTNSGGDFWLALHGLENEDPAGSARLIGAFLGRGLLCAQQAGHSDPFKSGHLPKNSQSRSVITDVALRAPVEFVAQVLPFVAEVAMANQDHTDGELPSGRRWRHRYIPPVYGVDKIVFAATESALCELAKEDPAAILGALASIRDAESAELRFLACRTLTSLPDADDAIGWLVSDTRNLALGWSNSPYWASREMIEQHSPSCSDDLFDRLQSAVLDFWPDWEGEDHRGHSQYELLSALDVTRLSRAAKRRLQELRDRFPDWPPEPPRPAVERMEVSYVDIGDPEHMSDDDWLQSLKRHASDAPHVGADGLAVGGARSVARMLGAAAKNDPPRFSSLALRLDDDIPAEAMIEIVHNIQGNVDMDALADVCEHAHRLYGSEVGLTVCRAIGLAGAANSWLVALLGAYAQDTDPDREEARTAAITGEPLHGEDLLTDGMNSTRGQVALSAASVLYATADHLDALMPVIEILAQDDVLAVRACAADAVTALGNHLPDQALDLAERIFDNAIEVIDAPTSERLLSIAVLRDPDRFGPILAEALTRPDNVATPAGRTWAVARWHDELPAGIATDASALPAAARRGAAEVFASSVADCFDDLRALFDDDDLEVQLQVGLAMRQLDQVPMSDQEALIDVFMDSASFPSQMGELMDALERMSSAPPPNTIDVCERVVGIAGADPAKSSARTGRHLIAVVLRLYRQEDQNLRTRCLDIIDKLAEHNLYDLEEALQDER